MRVPRKTKKKIPRGRYCYIYMGKSCPYWFFNKFDCGDCRYLYKETGVYNGEEELDLGLNDQCKACNLKID